MTRLLYFICLVLKQCVYAVFVLRVSQPESAVRVQPGHSTTLPCFTPDDGHFKVFWFKIQNSSAPVFVALAESDKTAIIIGDKFQDPTKYTLGWNKLSFSLSVLNMEQTDIAVYYCGIIIYREMYFGNGTRLMFEEHFNGTEKNEEKEDDCRNQFVFVWPTLITIIVMSILLNIILFYILKKHRAGISQTNGSQNSKTEEMNYVALTFAHNQKKIKQRPKKDQEPQVTYGAVKHQEN
ncbi:uncharacterized protein LOC113105271 [Carassius auratus]|uniref:Uncharacterized protein LOC113105271 n=1 Tax=Carassius auratus TaxID=7957 RepID=A0A6P6PN03_CARAU|nr:uncharacterized protein LOC113105271 [Carassius auratus]